MLVRALVSRGFTCCEAEDGLEALSEMLRKSNQSPRTLTAPIASTRSVYDASGGASMAGGGGSGLNGMKETSKYPSSNFPGGSFVSNKGTPLAGGGDVDSSMDSRTKLNHVSCANMLATSQLQHFTIDAVLIDFQMPKMNGPECIVELRNMGKTLSSLPVSPPIYQPTSPQRLTTHPHNT